MSDEHWHRYHRHAALPHKTLSQDTRWELLMALKAAAIILSVVAAIVIFHGGRPIHPPLDRDLHERAERSAREPDLSPGSRSGSNAVIDHSY
jgi:hypothetical protein